MNKRNTSVSATNAELDHRILGYDTYCPQCQKYQFPDNHTDARLLVSHRPAVVEVTYGQMANHIKRGYLLGVESDVAEAFRSLFEGDVRNEGYTLVAEEDDGGITLLIEELVDGPYSPATHTLRSAGSDANQHTSAREGVHRVE